MAETELKGERILITQLQMDANPPLCLLDVQIGD